MVRVVENRGRDIAPKLIGFGDVCDLHDLVLFLHTKNRHYYQHDDDWRDGLLRSLVGSPETVCSIVWIFSPPPDVGMGVAQLSTAARVNLLERQFLTRLADRAPHRASVALAGPIDFPSYSMFWARPDALAPPLQLRLRESPPERGQINKTFHHAIERLWLFSCEHAGFRWLKVSHPSVSIGSSPAGTSSTGEISRPSWRLILVPAPAGETRQVRARPNRGPRKGPGCP